MLHSPIPPNPLPSKFIWDTAKEHYNVALNSGIKRKDYVKAALECLLDIAEAVRNTLTEEDLQQSVLWPVQFYPDNYREFLRMHAVQKNSRKFKTMQKKLREARATIQRLQKSNKFFDGSKLIHELNRYTHSSAEYDIFVNQQFPFERDGTRWFGSIRNELNQLSRHTAEKKHVYYSDYEEPPFYIHKCFTIMAIQREDREKYDEWLDWEDIEALQQAEENLKIFLKKLDKKLDT